MVSCSIFVVSLSLALLVILVGLLLFIYSKKEGLGFMYKMASCIAIIFGTIVFIGGLFFATILMTCHSKKCNKENKCCSSEMKGKCCRTMWEGKSMRFHNRMDCEMHCEKNLKENFLNEKKDDLKK